MNWKQTAIATATALSLVGLTAYAQGSIQPVHGYGGMMGGDGMGPGMMGGYGGHGMGPGMMGGYGPYGMGPGMMGGYSLGAIERLDLSAEQRRQFGSIKGDLRRKNWALMEKMHDEMDALYDLSSSSGRPDRAAILEANKRMSDLRQQMLENSLEATDKAVALLTPEQREQYERLARARRDDDGD